MARTDITTNKRLVVRDMGKSGSFNGTSTFCTVPITPSTAGFSFGMWLKFDKGIANNARILDWQESGPTNGFTYIVTLTGSRISIQPRFYNAGSLDGQPTAYEPNTNDWVHTVVTYEPNSLKFYINGTLWSQDTSITMNASATTLTLGKRTGGSFANGYKGLIDGFTFVNGRAMTADEVTSLYTAGQHPDDTTCHIRFNDNVNDETKNKNNLTATALTYSTNVPIAIRSTTQTRLKIQNDGYTLNWSTLGANKNATVTPSAALAALGTSNLNYSAGIWFKESQVRATFGNILFQIRKNTPFRYSFQLRTYNSGKFGVAFYDGTVNPGLSTSNSYSINTWYHFVFTRQGSTIKIYVNGINTNTSTISVGDTTGDTVELGSSNAFAGNLSKGFIYDRVLTANEILDIYANNNYPSGALLYVPLNEGTGTTAYETSGNNLNFTINNGTWSTDTPTGIRSTS